MLRAMVVCLLCYESTLFQGERQCSATCLLCLEFPVLGIWRSKVTLRVQSILDNSSSSCPSNNRCVVLTFLQADTKWQTGLMDSLGELQKCESDRVIVENEGTVVEWENFLVNQQHFWGSWGGLSVSLVVLVPGAMGGSTSTRSDIFTQMMSTRRSKTCRTLMFSLALAS